MSNTALKWAYGRKVGSMTSKAVLISLAEQADDQTFACWPGQQLIAERTECNVRTVRRALASLEADGYLVRKARFDSVGHRTSDSYVLQVDSATAGQSDHRTEKPPVTRDRPPDFHDRPPDTAPGKPSVEPSVEPSAGDTAVAVAPGAKAAPARNRGHRLPDDWKRSELDTAWQGEQGIPDDFARGATERFKNHWLAASGSKAVKLDWSRAWKTWISNDWGGALGATYRREHKQAPGASASTELPSEAYRRRNAARRFG